MKIVFKPQDDVLSLEFILKFDLHFLKELYP